MTKSHTRKPSRRKTSHTPSPGTPSAEFRTPLLLTATEAAKALAISESTFADLTKRGLIPSVRFGRAVRYDRRDILTLIDERKARSVN